jgi:uncharacterized protein (TIGR00730 family)
VKRLCVFCGSSVGVRPAYGRMAREMASELCRRRVGVVYGGGGIGLMGVLADSMLAMGGEVVGVIPRPLSTKELAHTGLTEMHVVESMHERKALMASLADGFVAMPGGLGTFEETLEILTWSQLGIHRKPIGLLNVAGYYDGLLGMIAHAIEEGFVPREYRSLSVSAETPSDLLDAMETWRPPDFPGRWLNISQT